MPVYLAYDGSINASWISRYAVRMAANHPERRLNIIYIEDAAVPAPALEAGLRRVEFEAQAVGVTAEVMIRPMRQGVPGGLIDAIPEGPETFIVCGTRVKMGRRGLLRGTISERLLRLRRYNVIAIRVVQPGLLGLPGNLLAPVSGDPRGFQAGIPMLSLMARDIRLLHLLHVLETKRSRFSLMPEAANARKLAGAMGYIRGIEADLLDKLPIDPARVDSHVRMADNWTRETIVQAARLHAGLIFVEAPILGLIGRFGFGDAHERLLADSPCDVAVYRGAV
ncbi:MAG: universal stress protein [Rhodospirillales bacterium]|nr:universal stress protein [Rhodospirillales bacterium]MCW8862763.1 universal stress protein [Rhodospirillales bacterium]MCW8953011.1 universal stress protein [Rhodospirillales bacterium]MCW8971494.1 universal stress protein [Rhodospirillales bacterium]MCW9002307.1 universal stress protein [Rhodospirillales bacterium]